MAGVRLGRFTVEHSIPTVSFGDVEPGEVVEANGEPFIKMETTKLDNALSLVTHKPCPIHFSAQVHVCDIIATKNGLTFERRKVQPKPFKQVPPASLDPADLTPIKYLEPQPGDQPDPPKPKRARAKSK